MLTRNLLNIKITYALMLLLLTYNLQAQIPNGIAKSIATDTGLSTQPVKYYQKANPLNLSDKWKSPDAKKIIKKSLVYKAKITFGYDYGLVPVPDNTIMHPIPFYRTEGDMGINFFKVPLDISFYYSNVNAINNHVRVTFDPRKYQENLESNAEKKIAAEKNKLTELEQQIADVRKALLYFKYLKNNPQLSNTYERKLDSFKMHPSSNTLQNDVNGLENQKTNTSNKSQASDSLQLIKKYEKKVDSTINKKVNYVDSIQFVKEKLNDLKNAEKQISKYEAFLNTLESKKRQLVNKINSLTNAPKNGEKNYTSGGPGAQYLKGIKKLEIGLCYPSNSIFLCNNLALKGVHLEDEARNIYTSFTVGKVQDNMLFSTNQMQNILYNTRNLYNYFDFSTPQGGRNVFSTKLGYGKVNGTHLYAGVLYGLGYDSYTGNTENISATTYKERNLVFELDGAVNLKKYGKLSLVAGKSAITSYYNNNGSSLLDELFAAKHTAALQGSYEGTIDKTGTKVTITSRYIDPDFVSFGIGFIRSDNFRYSIKIDQKISKKLKISVTYKHEEDNLLDLYNYRDVLTTLNTQLRYTINRYWTVSVMYSPVFQQNINTQSNDNNTGTNNNVVNRSSIANAMVSFHPHLKKLQTQVQSLYNYYNVYYDGKPILMENISYLQQIQFKSGLNTNINLSWFDAKDTTIAKNKTWLLAVENNYNIHKKIIVSLTLKNSYSTSLGEQIGYKIKTQVPMNKHIKLEMSFEKLVIGDYYTNVFSGAAQKFPFYFSSAIIINF